MKENCPCKMGNVLFVYCIICSTSMHGTITDANKHAGVKDISASSACMVSFINISSYWPDPTDM